MKNFLLQCSLIIAVLLPGLAFAAFNDVTLTTSTILSVGAYTLNVTGSSAVIQSITINSGSFTVTMLAGSYLQVTSPTFQQLTADNSGLVLSNECSTGNSVLTLSSPSSSGTVTVTPQSTICSTPASSGGGGSGGGGGNGPIVGSIDASAAPTITSTSTSSPSSATSSIASLQNEVALLTAQLNALLSQVHGTTTGAVFTRNLSMGTTGDDVQTLQEFLISEASGPAALSLKAHGTTHYFGTLTYSALVEFQKKANIVPASGFLGPMTRAYVNGLKR